MSKHATPSPPNPGGEPNGAKPSLPTGWVSRLARYSFALLLVTAVSGLAITCAPFHAANQWNVLFHAGIGALSLLPLAWYGWQHWQDYRRHAWSHIVLLGQVAALALLVCAASGLVVTWQAMFGARISVWARQAHLYSTLALLVAVAPHLLFAYLRLCRDRLSPSLAAFLAPTLVVIVAGVVVVGGLTWHYSGPRYNNEFPKDYSFLYGTNRPFAPSLARTATGGAYDARSLSGSFSCGTAGCHEQIVKEWEPSAHRYAAMDTVFLGIQEVMAKQNGPESTRYCGGCHDPISLFSGTKNIFVENLTGLHGYQEGVSCLTCHAIRETDVKGNANYTVTQPREYLWQWQTNGPARLARDFLIRAYPDEHNKLAKRSFKKPEYCAACHKQFIDQEVNRVGWVQLQNQYDNWAASHWNHKGDARQTVECRECHMPLVASLDPAAGDSADYNRNAADGKHRSHRFLASNQFMPWALREKLAGWNQQMRLTGDWLRGVYEVPEIRDKWASGPIVKLAVTAPDSVAAGEAIPLRVVMASNKVGHDFPTGPLDIIQSWLEITVTDDRGHIVYRSGGRDAKNFIQPGTFLFKAEPVDQHGNLIDRHNLWEMVGVRYRRALFPGYSDTVQYTIQCPSELLPRGNQGELQQKEWSELQKVEVPAPASPGKYRVAASLQYRKVDQFLLNYLFGEKTTLTAPVTEIARASLEVVIRQPAAASQPVARQDK